MPHIKAIAGLIAAGVRGARVVNVPGAGHLVNLDAPEAFNRALDTFLAGR